MENEANTGDLGAVARMGVVWQGLGFGIAKLSMLASTIVMARVLGPDDYGFVAFAVVLVLAVTVVADLGASQAVVYLPQSAERFGAACVLAAGSSSTLALLWVVGSPFVASYLGRPDDVLMIGTLGLVIVLTSLGQPPDALLRKELKFSRRLPAELARGLSRGGVAIGLVLAGTGPWALVWGEVAGAAAFAVTSWVVAAPRLGTPCSWLKRGHRRTILAFGIPVALNGGLATAVANVDYVIIGSLLGTSAVGLYLVGFRIPELLVNSVFQVFAQVSYPVFTRLNKDIPRLGRAYLLALRVQAFWGLTVGVAIAVLAPVIVPVLFGEEYAASVPVMQAIAAYVVFGSLSTGVVDLFKALGKPQYGAVLWAIQLVILVPALSVAAQFSLTAVAVTQAAIALSFVVVLQRLACRLLDLPWSALLRTLAVPVAVAAAAAGAAVLATWLLGSAAEVVVLVVAGLTAAAASLLVLLLLDRPLLTRLMRG